ncbi:MAG: glucosidase, partial [Chloroflexi bacterium]|nr:glucosidase [Chloroflexota bacterium]
MTMRDRGQPLRAGAAGDDGEPRAAKLGSRQNPECRRLRELATDGIPWQRWGPYLAERQWGTVREDYSADGAAWSFLPHAHARSRAYRWGEDGLLGISDDQGLLCFAPALWNEADPILKERLFGVTGSEGNHGEDVKEYYFFLDSTPTHSYLKALYKYPQRAYPYDELVDVSRGRSRYEAEYELLDTGAFAENRYFDVVVEYAKASPEDILIRLSATNRGPDLAPLHILPTIWLRNTWSWGPDGGPSGVTEDGGRGDGETEGQGDEVRPWLRGDRDLGTEHAEIRAWRPELGEYWLACEGTPGLLFTENESNREALWSVPNATPYVKDGIGAAVVQGRREAINPQQTGTKAAAHYRFDVAPGETVTVRLRLSPERLTRPFDDAGRIFDRRIAEADEFYRAYGAAQLSDDARRVQRQAFAGLLWSKQFYYYDVGEWLEGDTAGPPPPVERQRGRNAGWRHLNNADVISMPDTWEYPWYAAWDLAFHCIP